MLLCKIQRSDLFFLLIMQTKLYSLSRLAPGRSLISSVLWSLLPCHFPLFLLPRHSSKMATGSHPFQVSVQTPLTREDTLPILEDALPILEDALPVPAGWKSVFCSSCYTHSPLSLWHKGYHFLSVLSTKTLALWTSPCSLFCPPALAIQNYLRSHYWWMDGFLH